ncbi:MAG: hypothetical protein RJA09_860 [Pseudomonadota bacterium]|jgi:hypothetical protein
MLTTLILVKLVLEIALLALVGRWVVGLLSGQRRDQNFFYQILHIMVRPFLSGVRLVTPRLVVERHLPLVTFLILGFAWLAVTVAKVQTCVQMGVALCK